MGYKILSNDLFNDNKPAKKAPRRRRRTVPTPQPQRGINVKPIHIHLVLISIVILVLLFYFVKGLDFGSDNANQETILLIGTLDEFNETFKGDIKIFSTDFTLKTKSGQFNSNSKDVTLTNFSGNILLQNNTIYFIGIAQKAEYGQNTLNIDNQYFELASTKKTNIELFYDNLSLSFTEGRIKVNDELNFEFKNTTINLNNFNTTFSFDGIFSFTGVADNFILESTSPKLKINYNRVIKTTK